VINESEIRIVELDTMRVACHRAVSSQPEIEAFSTLVAWAKNQGLLDKKETRFFGFNNPGPSKDEAEYGYEVWATVDADIGGSGNIKIKEFPGGKYAVMRTGLPRVKQGWEELVAWLKASSYIAREGLCLEEHLSLPTDHNADSVILDLYLPIQV
jgi:AraC family transcriptional regulator